MKKQHILLSDSDRSELCSKLSKGVLSVRVQKRMQALQYLDMGKSYEEVSSLLSVHYVTVSCWAKEYNSLGLLFLTDKPRSGRPSKIDVVTEHKITALACTSAPEGRSRWSLRLLADKLVELEIVESISFVQVGTVLKKRTSAPSEASMVY
ncbi:MAG: transposase [Bacteroidia bacterium]